MKNLSDWKVFQNRNSDFKKIAYFDNPHSIMDNVARVSLIILYALTAYILLTGGIYHYEIFQTSMGNGAISIILSLGFFAVIEVLKVFFGTYFMRGILSGDAGETKVHMTTYGILLCVCIFGFWWSWNISTDAAPTLNKIINLAEGKSRHNDSTELKAIGADLALLDAQISDVNASEKTGFSVRYKGVVTQKGQDIARTAATTRATLTSQRSEILSRYNTEKDRLRTATDAQMGAASTQLSQYGGFAEVLQIVFLLLTALCEAISYMKTKKDIADGKIQKPIKKPVGFQDLLSPYAQNNTTSNTPHSEQPTERQPIGFRINQAPTPSVLDEVLEIKKPVAQTKETVAQSKAEIKYSELDDKLERLRADILKNSESHFRRGDAKNNTVAKRIFEACDKAFLALKKGGDLTPSVLKRFKEAALDRLALCNSHECYYDSYDDLIKIISNKEANNG